jgi:ribonuclease P protein component
MLPKQNRLKAKQDFTTVYQKGVRLNCFALGLRAYRHHAELRVSLPLRVGISISHKVSKKAVVRNRIKRQLRFALRQLLPNLECGWDVVIVVYPNALQCDYPEFLQQLKQLLAQTEILHGD